MRHNQMARRRYNAAQAGLQMEALQWRLNRQLCSRIPADFSGTQFWPLYQFRFGVETGNNFRSVKLNPGINPEPSSDPKADLEDK
jgi:hypothetical protein